MLGFVCTPLGARRQLLRAARDRASSSSATILGLPGCVSRHLLLSSAQSKSALSYVTLLSCFFHVVHSTAVIIGTRKSAVLRASNRYAWHRAIDTQKASSLTCECTRQRKRKREASSATTYARVEVVRVVRERALAAERVRVEARTEHNRDVVARRAAVQSTDTEASSVVAALSSAVWTQCRTRSHLLQNSSSAVLSGDSDASVASGAALAAVARHTRLPFFRSVSQIEMRFRRISTTFAFGSLRVRSEASDPRVRSPSVSQSISQFFRAVAVHTRTASHWIRASQSRSRRRPCFATRTPCCRAGSSTQSFVCEPTSAYALAATAAIVYLLGRVEEPVCRRRAWNACVDDLPFVAHLFDHAQRQYTLDELIASTRHETNAHTLSVCLTSGARYCARPAGVPIVT